MIGVERDDDPSARHRPEESGHQSSVQGRGQGYGPIRSVQRGDGLGCIVDFAGQLRVGPGAVEVVDGDVAGEAAGDQLEAVR